MSKLGVKAYQIDLDNEQDRQTLLNYLIARGSKIDHEEALRSNTFILKNKFDDFWLQDATLPQSFQGEIQYFYKYFEGPRTLPLADHLLCA